jgi:hypothetical protein
VLGLKRQLGLSAIFRHGYMYALKKNEPAALRSIKPMLEEPLGARLSSCDPRQRWWEGPVLLPSPDYGDFLLDRAQVPCLRPYRRTAATNDCFSGST